MSKTPVILLTSGMDPTGGAGMSADIRTCARTGSYPLSCITALTVQNQHCVKSINPTHPDLLRDQIDAAVEAARPDAVKIGLLPTPETVETVAEAIRRHNLRNVVIDPVLAPTAAGRLIDRRDDTARAMIRFLFPLASLITPNVKEASLFRAMAGRPLNTLSPYLLLKGGDTGSEACTDSLYRGPELLQEYTTPRIASPNLHGTGCVLSSAIASYLGHGLNMAEAVGRAKRFVHEAIQRNVNNRIIEGYGPVLE
jgi:hydroxymethylpyrimidine/phosphomethylpyrimidine kinase